MKHEPLEANRFHEICCLLQALPGTHPSFRFFGAHNKMTLSLGQTIRCLPIFKAPRKIADEFSYITEQPSIFRSIPGVSSMDVWPSENMDPAWQRHCHRSLDLQRSLWWISDVLGICWMVIFVIYTFISQWTIYDIPSTPKSPVFQGQAFREVVWHDYI